MPVLVTPSELARTYNSQSYEDAWKAVEDYQRVLEYTGRHPNKGSSAVASKLNLPRGRVHPWMNGSRPDPVRAIQIAEEHNWLPLATEDEVFPAFNRLVAWVFSRGSITEAEYSPLFTCHKTTEQDRLGEVFHNLGIEYTLYREDSTDRATEARISTHRTIIGRLLVLLGAPLGPRTDATTLPQYLTPATNTTATTTTESRTASSNQTPAKSVPSETDDHSHSSASTQSQEHARTFAETYLANTARYWAWREGFVIRHEDRSTEYLRRLATVFEQANTETGIEVNADSIFLPTALAEELCPQLSDRRSTAD